MPRTTSNSSARRDVEHGSSLLPAEREPEDGWSGSLGSMDTSFDPDDWAKEFDTELELLATAHDEIMLLEGSGNVENGLITVVVDGPGRVQELIIHPDAFRETSPQELAELLMEALSKAYEDLDIKVAAKSQLLNDALET